MASLLEEAVLLQHIINDLQDLAAADAGQLRLHPEPVWVGDLLDQVATAHLSRADVAGIALAVATVGEPEISADPVRLRQAVGNLVSNALRHTAAGGSVTIGCRLDAGQVVIEVEAHGGAITATSVPGRRTVFTIRLPLTAAPGWPTLPDLSDGTTAG